MKKFLFAGLLSLVMMSVSGWVFIGAPAGASITPLTSIGTGLQIWLDPTDNATITQSGGVASQITDKSGNGVTFSQATAGKRFAVTASAINGLQAFTATVAGATSFTGTMAAGLTDFTVCALVKQVTNGLGQGILTDYVATGNINFILDDVTNNALGTYITSVGDKASGGSGTFPTGTPYWVCGTYDHAASTGTITTYMNNSQVGQSTSVGNNRSMNKALGWPTDTGWSLSNDAIFGDLAVWNNVLSSGDRGLSYTSFAKPKWGLP